MQERLRDFGCFTRFPAYVVCVTAYLLNTSWAASFKCRCSTGDYFFFFFFHPPCKSKVLYSPAVLIWLAYGWTDRLWPGISFSSAGWKGDYFFIFFHLLKGKILFAAAINVNMVMPEKKARTNESVAEMLIKAALSRKCFIFESFSLHLLVTNSWVRCVRSKLFTENFK